MLDEMVARYDNADIDEKRKAVELLENAGNQYQNAHPGTQQDNLNRISRPVPSTARAPIRIEIQ